MRGRLSTRLALAMAVVAVVTAALALPAAIVYTEHRLDGLPAADRDAAMARIELNSWDDFDGLAEWAAVSLVAGSVAVAIGWLLARRITRPLRSISRTAHLLATGDLSARAGLGRRDELGRLAADFDAMAEDLERLEDERRTAAAVTAHELRTPVTVVRGRLQAASDGLLDLDAAELAVLIGQLDGLTRIIEDLRVLSLATAGRLTLHPEPVDLRQVVTAQVAVLGAASGERDVRVGLRPGPPVTVVADRDRIAQVVTNLVLNAVRHSPPGGEVLIECTSGVDGPTGEPRAAVAVSDAGEGFPAELADPFEPFTSARPTGGPSTGSGLGLAVVKAVVDAHGGRVEVSDRTTGATVTFTLPDGSPG